MILLYTVIGLLLLFLLVLVTRAIWVKARARALGSYIDHESPEKQEYYADRLARMIRCQTVSREDSFAPEEFKKLHRVMEELFPLIHSRGERMIFSDDCWIYRLPGKDTGRNIMLMSHHDVVKAEGNWTYPPFGGEIHDGALWGRGTVDTKTPLFAEFSALEELLESGWEPPVNVYIGSSHNEELGGDGIPLARDYFKKRGIRFELILDEGGAVISPPLPGMKCTCAMLAVHEKGRCYLRCRAEENKGHASLTPGKGTPVERMSRFIAESQGIFLRRMYPEVRAMFESLCPYLPFPLRLVFSNLWCFRPLLVRLIPAINASAGSMLGTTCSFRGIHGGKQEEKTEDFCECTALLRCVDDKDQQKDLEALKQLGQKHGVTVEVTELEFYPPANMDCLGYQHAKKTAEKMFPASAVSPFILPAGTDARHMRDVSDAVVRFAPIAINDQQYGSVHGDDENISLPAIGNAVAYYRELLRSYPDSL